MTRPERGNITSLADLSRPGVKIAVGTEEVLVGINTQTAIDKLANSTLVLDRWKDDVFNNVVTYETTEPGVVTKSASARSNAGFVYESSYRTSKALVLVVCLYLTLSLVALVLRITPDLLLT